RETFLPQKNKEKCQNPTPLNWAGKTQHLPLPKSCDKALNTTFPSGAKDHVFRSVSIGFHRVKLQNPALVLLKEQWKNSNSPLSKERELYANVNAHFGLSIVHVL
ncbi:hypothetical protein T4C_10668, partial [Trichinella pseudospiralis]